jgi:sporulation protein YlmC with PRC-barrel domain
VVARDGSRLGVVENLLLRPDGQIDSTLIKAKAFLGLVECRMAIPWRIVKAADDSRKILVELTKEEFNSLPEWECKKAPELRLAKPE